MALTIDGVLIPEDHANALTVNGSDVTAVWADGVQVWAQQLFAAQWSGDSYLEYNYNSYVYDWSGINVSGGMFRAAAVKRAIYMALEYSSTWIITNIDGTFSASDSKILTDVSGNKAAFRIVGVGTNQLYVGSYNYFYGRWELATMPVTFDISSGFTGMSQSPSGASYLNLETSGGLVRLNDTGDTKLYPSPWISLT